MATFSHKLYHPTNQNPEDIYKGFSWGAFFFGAFWFAYKGLWIPAILLFVSYFLLAIGFLFHLIIAYFAWGIHEKHFLSKGYLRLHQLSGNNLKTSPLHGQQAIQQINADQSAAPSTSQIQPQGNLNTSAAIGNNLRERPESSTGCLSVVGGLIGMVFAILLLAGGIWALIKGLSM